MIVQRILGESAPRAPYPGEYTNPMAAFWYANGVVKRRWPQGEEAIAKDAEMSTHYALYVLKKRFLRGEPAILKNPTWACFYARLVLNRRWPEAEEAIAKSQWAKDYLGTFPEARQDWAANGWIDWLEQ